VSVYIYIYIYDIYVLYFICIHYALRLISNSNIDFQNLIFIFVPNISFIVRRAWDSITSSSFRYWKKLLF